MVEKILVGLIINSIWLIHLFKSNKLTLVVKFIAFLTLLIPYLGFVVYFIMFVMVVPSPQPRHLRQNKMNHYGRTEFGEDDYSEYESKREYYPPIKSEVRKKSRLKPKKLHVVYRLAAFVVGTYIALLGVASIKLGTWSYHNWWGGTVFGPFAIGMGAYFIYLFGIKSGK